MQEILLSLHVAGAAISIGLSIAVGGFLLWGYRSLLVRTHAHPALLGLATFQVFSGALIALLSPTVTALSVCDNLLLYAAIIAVPLIAMHRMELRTRGYRETVVLRGLYASIIFFIGTLAVGL